MNGMVHRSTLVAGMLLTLLVTLIVPAGPLPAAEAPEAQLFIAGFNDFQGREYTSAVEKLSRFMKEYPASPLRDMTLYWLARSLYHAGDRAGAARTMARFLREYPDHPLRGTVERELLTLAAGQGRGDVIARGPDPGASGGGGTVTPHPTVPPPPAPSPASSPPLRTAPTAPTEAPAAPAPVIPAPPSPDTGSVLSAVSDDSSVRTITIRRGDTLAKLAKRYGCTVTELRRLNRIKGNLIFAGALLRVPAPPFQPDRPASPPSVQESR